MARRLSPLVFVGVLAGCDPGWSYRVPGAVMVMEDGRNFDIAAGAGVAIRAYASQFTSGLSVRLGIKNRGATSLVVEPGWFLVFDGYGLHVPAHQMRNEPLRCEGRPDEVVVKLQPDEVCTVSAHFFAPVDEHRMRTVTVFHSGVSRAGAVVPISITFEKD